MKDEKMGGGAKLTPDEEARIKAEKGEGGPAGVKGNVKPGAKKK
ncbi:hypothetical protein [Aurantiacibacter gilvus]|uniref:Uncharacterized protein n=1 Tax=Aurantiacibacter gilvus TaxID=3139141 RepID=A0ABU9IBQ4_9SPHN